MSTNTFKTVIYTIYVNNVARRLVTINSKLNLEAVRQNCQPPELGF